MRAASTARFRSVNRTYSELKKFKRKKPNSKQSSKEDIRCVIRISNMKEEHSSKMQIVHWYYVDSLLVIFGVHTLQMRQTVTEEKT